MPLLYHLVEPDYWKKFMDKDRYVSAGFEEEGFIHLSLREQVDGVLERFYQQADELLVLIVSEKPVRKHLKYEPGGDVDELFPHLYQGIPIEAIEDIKMLKRNRERVWEWIS